MRAIMPNTHTTLQAGLATAGAAQGTASLAAPQTPEQLYDALVEGAAPKQRNNLRNLRDALEHLRALKQPDFRPAAVGRAVLALGHKGPKTQSIRNEEGAPFRALIAAYGAAYGAARPAPLPTSAEEEEALIAAIPDHRVAFEVRAIVTEVRSLRMQVNIAHRMYGQLPPIPAGPPPASTEPPRALPAPGGSRLPDLTPTELQAIRRFAESIPEMWDVDPDTRAVCHPDGYEIAPPGLYDALQRIAAAS